MPDLVEIHNTSISEATPELREAVILDDATALGQEVRCVVPSESEQLATDPMPWMPYGSKWPQRGDRAVLGFPVDGPPVILFWSPESGPGHLYPAEDLYPSESLYPA